MYNLKEQISEAKALVNRELTRHFEELDRVKSKPSLILADQRYMVRLDFLIKQCKFDLETRFY